MLHVDVPQCNRYLEMFCLALLCAFLLLGMTEEHRLALRKSAQSIIRDLISTPILDDLRSNAHISNEDFARLGDMRVRHDQARGLLSLLTQQGSDVFEVFKRSLLKNQPHLYKELTETLQRIKDGMF